MNIQLRLITEKNIDQLASMGFSNNVVKLLGDDVSLEKIAATARKYAREEESTIEKPVDELPTDIPNENIIEIVKPANTEPSYKKDDLVKVKDDNDKEAIGTIVEIIGNDVMVKLNNGNYVIRSPQDLQPPTLSSAVSSDSSIYNPSKQSTIQDRPVVLEAPASPPYQPTAPASPPYQPTAPISPPYQPSIVVPLTTINPSPQPTVIFPMAAEPASVPASVPASAPAKTNLTDVTDIIENISKKSNASILTDIEEDNNEDSEDKSSSNSEKKTVKLN